MLPFLTNIWPVGCSREEAARNARRCMIARATLSAAVRLLNSRVTWKVRTRPRCTRPVMPRCVIFSPIRKSCPSVGGVSPEMTLTSVVFPAPLGPISATRSPALRPNETSRLTWRPPKDFDSPSNFRRSVMGVPPAWSAWTTALQRHGTSHAARTPRQGSTAGRPMSSNGMDWLTIHSARRSGK